MVKDIKNIDPRQVELFTQKPSITRRIGYEGTERMRTYVAGERFKTGWVSSGNIYLKGTKEMIKKEDWEKLDSFERELLQKVGTERFNKTISETVRVGNRLYGSGTDIYKVYSALKDGYTTYEEVEQITGFSRNAIGKLIKELVKGGYLKSNKPPATSASTIASTGTPPSSSPSRRTGGNFLGPTGPRANLSGGRMSGNLSIRGGIIT